MPMTDARKKTDVRVRAVELYYLPVETRMPLKFGPETLTSVTCVRAKVTVADATGRRGDGWGETPLSVQWFWPADLTYASRHQTLKEFCQQVAKTWVDFDRCGHPIELGYAFQHEVLPDLTRQFNSARGGDAMPYLAALGAASALDLALHDAYGNLHQRDTYTTYNADFMSFDLAHFLSPADASDVSFAHRFPQDFLVTEVPQRLRAWHLVAGLDPLNEAELTGTEPDDGHPVVLRDWIRTDGLTCLKVKLRGNNADWDFARLLAVGEIGLAEGVEWLSTDFNCTVTDPEYVNAILDKLREENPRIYGMILYVEQPFPYDLEAHRIDVHGVAARKPLFLDESAHDWQFVRLGRELGWSGVALKTCKTQTGALLSLCWAKAHGMPLMVQDLTNPMLAQVTHLRLAAHAGTIMGVETNSMQFYPEASASEASVHPGMYCRRDGRVDLSTLQGSGFGYRLAEIPRTLPAAAFQVGG
jgi:L-alanine-DL-glutamate epimerase-like enolase superfamily enzyme